MKDKSKQVNKFLNHLYIHIWKYIIRKKHFDAYWASDKDRDYDPFDFLTDNIPELINNLKDGFPLHESYHEVIGNIDLSIRQKIIRFMTWVSNMENLGVNGMYNAIYSGETLELQPLEDLVEIVENSEMPNVEEDSGAKDKMIVVLNVLERFTSATKSLTIRRKGKRAFTIKDEYDMQDILHLVLKSLFPTTRQEQVVSGNADKQFLKIDFLIASEKVGIECKFIRDPMHAKNITKEINDDIQTYHQHQDCSTLIFFVYDKKLLISNPDVLEEQYTAKQKFEEKEMSIILKIRPKN